MKQILTNIANKLLTVKSLVTLLLAGVFAALALRGIINGEQFLQVWLIVIGFYFGTQHEKRSSETGGDAT